MTDPVELGMKDTSGGCARCETSLSTDAPTSARAAVTEVVLVSGMTCSHCVSSVTQELTAIDGVDKVTVDLNAGGASRVTIHSVAPIHAVAVKTAVEEAGYTLAGTHA